MDELIERFTSLSDEYVLERGDMLMISAVLKSNDIWLTFVTDPVSGVDGPMTFIFEHNEMKTAGDVRKKISGQFHKT